MSSYPCPNPICTHTFTPEQVRSAVALKCPACGQSFQFRAGTTPSPPQAAKPAPRPAQTPPARPPLARPVTPRVPLAAKPTARTPPPAAIPVADPVRMPTAPASDSFFGHAEPARPEPISPFAAAVGDRPLVEPPMRRAGWSRKHYLLLTVSSVLGCAAVLGTVLAIKSIAPAGVKAVVADNSRVFVGQVRNQKNANEMAYRLTLGDKGWATDKDLRMRLGVDEAWKNKNKEGWFAVAVRDYGVFRPREAELLRSGIERLEQCFEGSLELAEKAEPARIGEADGQRLLFRGQLNSVTWWGHMYMLAHQGLGYWIYSAAPTKEEAAELFAKELQGGDSGFVLATDRSGWREQPPKLETFATSTGTLTAAAPAGVFVKHPAKDQDERAELYLFAKYQKEQDNRKNADVLVLALDNVGDLKEAMKNAKKYLEDKKQEESMEYKLVVAGEGGAASDLGSAAPVGNQPGRIAEYKLTRGDAPVRFWMVAVVNAADQAYVIRCDCTWESRPIWREDFQELLRTVKIRDGKSAD